MMHDISDEILSAHIDNELDAGEQAQLLERIATDAATRERACRLWQLKQMLPRRLSAATSTASHPSATLGVDLAAVGARVGGLLVADLWRHLRLGRPWS